jgi:hypothetical protein
MAEHPVNNPGNFTYHHCADLQITADPTKPIAKGWPPETLPHILDIGWRLETTPRSLALCNEQEWLPTEQPLAERRRAQVA